MVTEMQNAKPRKSASIDFRAIWMAIKTYKALYYKMVAASIVLGVIIGFSIPKTYNCQVLLAPETGVNNNIGGGLASLASNFGVDIGNSSKTGGDAITPSLYPDLMKSVDFKTSLFPVKVKRKTDKQTMTYYNYLKNEWREPWWMDFFGLLSPKKEKDTLVNNFELTVEQSRIAGMINKYVICRIDKKTSLITIDVTAQDPHVAAMLADSVKTRLQDFLTEYRTSKARHDLEYAEMLKRQAKKEYDYARRLYAEFADANLDITLESVRQKMTDLENEMQLQYNNYSAVSAQVITTRAKVQEVTPAFTPVQSATVPLGPSGPKKMQIILICSFVSLIVTTVYALSKEGQLKSIIGIS